LGSARVQKLLHSAIFQKADEGGKYQKLLMQEGSLWWQKNGWNDPREKQARICGGVVSRKEAQFSAGPSV